MKGLGLGRIVWYTPPGPGGSILPTQPALVCAVKSPEGGTVHLHVFPVGSSYLASDVPYSEQPRPNTWRWPERAA